MALPVLKFAVLMLYAILDFFLSTVDMLSDHWQVEAREERVAHIFNDAVEGSLLEQESGLILNLSELSPPVAVPLLSSQEPLLENRPVCVGSSGGSSRPQASPQAVPPQVPPPPTALRYVRPRQWYVVTSGIVPGVYDTWEGAQAQTGRVSGQCCKGGFKSYASAEIYYMQSFASGNVHVLSR